MRGVRAYIYCIKVAYLYGSIIYPYFTPPPDDHNNMFMFMSFKGGISFWRYLEISEVKPGAFTVTADYYLSDNLRPVPFAVCLVSFDLYPSPAEITSVSVQSGLIFLLRFLY